MAEIQKLTYAIITVYRVRPEVTWEMRLSRKLCKLYEGEICLNLELSRRKTVAICGDFGIEKLTQKHIISDLKHNLKGHNKVFGIQMKVIFWYKVLNENMIISIFLKVVFCFRTWPRKHILSVYKTLYNGRQGWWRRYNSISIVKNCKKVSAWKEYIHGLSIDLSIFQATTICGY